MNLGFVELAVIVALAGAAIAVVLVLSRGSA
jgi:hypothetical protein